MKKIEIVGYQRANLGRTESQAIRAEGNVPGVLYGGDDQVHFYAPAILFRDFHLVSGAIALVLGALAANLILGQFKPGWTAMPIAHSASVWTFLAMTLAGLAYTLSGGCPGRHLFLSGEGNEDSVVFVLGLIAGAALAHNFALAAAPDQMVEGVLKVGGPALYGKIAVVVGLAYCIALGFVARGKRAEGGQS